MRFYNSIASCNFKGRTDNLSTTSTTSKRPFQANSIFQMKRPFDLVAFMAQEARAEQLEALRVRRGSHQPQKNVLLGKFPFSCPNPMVLQSRIDSKRSRLTATGAARLHWMRRRMISLSPDQPGNDDLSWAAASSTSAGSTKDDRTTTVYLHL